MWTVAGEAKIRMEMDSDGVEEADCSGIRAAKTLSLSLSKLHSLYKYYYSVQKKFGCSLPKIESVNY